jgi:protein-tyrosine-phosphatase
LGIKLTRLEIRRKAMKKISYTLIVFVITLFLSHSANPQSQKVEKMRKPIKEPQIVVFVCEHGSAKSVVAAAHFNRIAKERNLNLRAISRGTNPDKELPSSTIKGLKSDGLTADDNQPRKLSKADVAGAVRTVAFCKIPEAYTTAARMEQWDDVPPMSEDYNRFRDIIVERMKRLLDELESAK